MKTPARTRLVHKGVVHYGFHVGVVHYGFHVAWTSGGATVAFLCEKRFYEFGLEVFFSLDSVDCMTCLVLEVSGG